MRKLTSDTAPITIESCRSGAMRTFAAIMAATPPLMNAVIAKSW